MKFVPIFIYLLVGIFLLNVQKAWCDSSTQNDSKDWWKDKIKYDGQILTLLNLQEPSDVPQNPGNDFLKLESRSWEFHVRPNIYFNYETLRLGIKPRFIETYKQFTDGTQKGKEAEKTELFLNEGYLQWRIIPSTFISLQRKNLQWGSGFLTSPSNPFYQTTGKTRPDQELRGKDFIQIDYIPTDWLAVSFLANYGKGEFVIKGSKEKFQKVYALKGELTFENFTANPVFSYEEHDRFRFGGYGSWTASDAVLLFLDFSLAAGSKGRYVEPSSTSSLGSEFKESYDDSKKIFPQILAGGSYTFLDGTTLHLEYLYYGPGYTSSQARRYYNLLDRAAEDYFYDGSNSSLLKLKDFAEEQLYFAYQNNLAFLRKNYLMIYANRNDLWKKLDLTTGWVQNLDDRSFYIFNFLDFKITDWLSIYSNTLLYSQNHRTEYRSPLKYLATLGLRYYF